MKRIILSLIAAALLAVSLPASAASYYGYIRNWWVEENGDISFYFLSNPDVNTTTPSQYVTGLCGWGVWRLKVGQANYSELYLSLLMASRNNYKTILEVTTCSAQVNIIKMAKVCTWNGDC